MIPETFYYETCYQRDAIAGHKHYHNTWEFYYLEEGQCSYLIDDQLYSVEAGDLVIIPNQVIHSVTYVDRHSRLLINCRETFLEALPLPGDPVYRNPEASREIRDLFIQVGEEYRKNDPYSPVLLQGAMHRLVALLARNPNLYPTDRSANRLIDTLLRELNEDFSGEVTLAEAARRHYVSPEHLSRRFKRETGMNFSEYLTLLRLKKAERLLIHDPDMPISQVALAAGFNDSNYFSKRFHMANGCTPSDFRHRKRT